MMSSARSPFIPFISSREVDNVLKYEDLIPVIEHALADFSRGKEGGVVQPLRTVCPVEDRNGRFFTMPCYSKNMGIIACKLMTSAPWPSEDDAPRVKIITALFGAHNGSLQAIVDSETLTSMRTAASSAVATKYLAPTGSRILTILGAGLVAGAHLEALAQVIQFSEIRVWTRTFSKAVTFAEKFGCAAFETAEEAVNNADVIVTVTRSHTPVLMSDWVKDGAHVNCVGAITPVQQELDPVLIRRAVIYVDSVQSASTESGDIVKSEANIFGEIGEVALGKLPARKNETTVFKSLGLAIEDAAASKLVYDKYYKPAGGN
ncbi:ketimine reductase mu-crystallin-like [Acanthaster planci]|uniref:Ketimine reductase mu-crystallin n=1 Tax=Acanthaster planci TaxID=133434 RepID=A0A8B7ZNU2_ACAPL|nr:ketimine reductase mu-crystallin-like [Acanthaster planci]XP_022105056.1 ketimine reductase mu-crystallin-like [Acanthaster planci]XP_022105063.1 ketimine reductase mu-crystallin-like [Acanthaster planci]